MKLAILAALTVWVFVMPLFNLVIRWPREYPLWKRMVVHMTYTLWGILSVTTLLIGTGTLVMTMFAMWLAARLLKHYLKVNWEEPKVRQFIYCGSFFLWGFCLGNLGSTLSLF